VRLSKALSTQRRVPYKEVTQSRLTKYEFPFSSLIYARLSANVIYNSAPAVGSSVQGATSDASSESTPRFAGHPVEVNNSTQDKPKFTKSHSNVNLFAPAIARQLTYLRKIMDEGNPERLETEATKSRLLLGNIKQKLAPAMENKDAHNFLQQMGRWPLHTLH
jgi:hypothetical protein